MDHTQRWKPVCPKLRRVQERARAHPEEQFTSLAQHLTVRRLEQAFRAIDPRAAAGIDGVTKQAYGRNVKQNLLELHDRLRRGKYRARPVLRKWIGKAGGDRRPLGLPTVEDKIVQGAVAEVLSSIYEGDFMGFNRNVIK